MSTVSTVSNYPADTVLLGEEVSLARIAGVPVGRLKGIVCLRGSVVSHTAAAPAGSGFPP